MVKSRQSKAAMGLLGAANNIAGQLTVDGNPANLDVTAPIIAYSSAFMTGNIFTNIVVSNSADALYDVSYNEPNLAMNLTDKQYNHIASDLVFGVLGDAGGYFGKSASPDTYLGYITQQFLPYSCEVFNNIYNNDTKKRK
jgi:hypothetical protein